MCIAGHDSSFLQAQLKYGIHSNRTHSIRVFLSFTWPCLAPLSIILHIHSLLVMPLGTLYAAINYIQTLQKHFLKPEIHVHDNLDDPILCISSSPESAMRECLANCIRAHRPARDHNINHDQPSSISSPLYNFAIFVVNPLKPDESKTSSIQRICLCRSSLPTA